MKKIYAILAVLLFATSCQSIDSTLEDNTLILTGYSSAESRTHFGTPESSQIPYFWSEAAPGIFLPMNRKD